MQTRIDIYPIMKPNGVHKAIHYGELYCVKLGDETIIESTHEPFYNGARVLASRGITGEMAMWASGKERMTGNIPPCAEISVQDGERGLVLVKYRGFDTSGLQNGELDD